MKGIICLVRRKSFLPSKRSRKCAFDFHFGTTFRKLRIFFGSFRREPLTLPPARHSTNCLHSIWMPIDVYRKQKEKARKSEEHHIFGRRRGKQRLESGTKQILPMRGAQACFPFIISRKFYIVIRLFTTFYFSLRLPTKPNQMKFFIFAFLSRSGE